MRTKSTGSKRRQLVVAVLAVVLLSSCSGEDNNSASGSEVSVDEAVVATIELGAVDYTVELSGESGSTTASGTFDFERNRGQVEIASQDSASGRTTYVFVDDDLFIRFADELIPPFLVEANTPWIHLDLAAQGASPTATALAGATAYFFNLDTALRLAAQEKQGAADPGTVLEQAEQLIPADAPEPSVRVAGGTIEQLQFPAVQNFAGHEAAGRTTITIDVTANGTTARITPPPASEVIPLDDFIELNQRAATEGAGSSSP